MQYDFRASVRGICKEYNLDEQQVAETYASRPGRLCDLYGGVAKARNGLFIQEIAAGFATASSLVPLVALSFWRAGTHIHTLSTTKKTVRDDIIAFERARARPG
jgi:hypothetical protein